MSIINIDDITNALQFLESRNNLILLAPTREEVPLIKREILHRLGEPRKTIGHALYYGTKSIEVLPLTIGRAVNYKEIKGLNNNLVFYVGLQDQTDDLILENAGMHIVPYPFKSLDLWKHIKLPVDAMLRALQVDGYSEEESVDILFSCGLLC